jgi:hypothetical protein
VFGIEHAADHPLVESQAAGQYGWTFTVTTCTVSKEYIYLGGRVIAVANCGAQ